MFSDLLLLGLTSAKLKWHFSVLYETFPSLPLPFTAPYFELIGSFSTDDGDVNENVKTAIGLLRKTTSSHVHHAF